MKVLFVVNNFYVKGNGLSASAQRTVQKLRESGLEVEVLSGPNPDPSRPGADVLIAKCHHPLLRRNRP
jgi:hypothetical protein